MREVRAWFDRTFDVPYPPALLPQLLTRLRGTPARLEETTRGNSRERLVARMDDRWSAQETAGHLLDLEPLWLARVDDFVSARSELTPADLTNRTTSEANHNARSLYQILADFRVARASLLDRVATVDPALFTGTIRHPRLGTPFTLADHLYFVAEHDDHHLAGIWDLLAKERE